MKFTKIQLVGQSTIDLPIVGALPSDSFILKNVDGLGPPDVDVSLSSAPVMGGSYLGRRPQNRQLVIRIGLNPSYSTGQTPADLRATVYNLLSGPGDVVTVNLIDAATTVVSTQGYVTKLETVPFSKDPEVQVTLLCPNPLLTAPAAVTITSLPLAQTSAPPGYTFVLAGFRFTNTGGAETGFYLKATCLKNEPYFLLARYEDNALPAAKSIFVLRNFLTGDVVEYDSRLGSRKIQVTRGGVVTNLLGYIDTTARWPMARVGINDMILMDAATSPGFAANQVIYTPQYWGV